MYELLNEKEAREYEGSFRRQRADRRMCPPLEEPAVHRIPKPSFRAITKDIPLHLKEGLPKGILAINITLTLHLLLIWAYTIPCLILTLHQRIQDRTHF